VTGHLSYRTAVWALFRSRTLFVGLIFNISLYIQAKGDYNQAIGFGFRPERAKQGGLDLACLGRKVFPPEDMAAKLTFLGPFGEEKKPLFLERPFGWLGFASLFISAEMAYFSLFISAAYKVAFGRKNWIYQS
jgi:hypothetical protein